MSYLISYFLIVRIMGTQHFYDCELCKHCKPTRLLETPKFSVRFDRPPDAFVL